MAMIGARRTTAVRRRYLISLSIMGLIVSVLGSTGLFAALTDSARTGTNNLDAAPLAGSAELKIQAGVVPPPDPTGPPPTTVTCALGGWVDDLTTGGFVANNVGPGFDSGVSYYCLQNAGSQTVSLAGTIDSLLDIDIVCTGDEALYNDLTCGNQLEGELKNVIEVMWSSVNCFDINQGSTTGIGIEGNVGAPVDLGSIAPGQIRCFGLRAIYSSANPPDAIQRAQSDHLSWRFKFTGTV